MYIVPSFMCVTRLTEKVLMNPTSDSADAAESWATVERFCPSFYLSQTLHQDPLVINNDTTAAASSISKKLQNFQMIVWLSGTQMFAVCEAPCGPAGGLQLAHEDLGSQGCAHHRRRNTVSRAALPRAHPHPPEPLPLKKPAGLNTNPIWDSLLSIQAAPRDTNVSHPH